jgi:putative ABC transport system permease protein
MRTNYGESVRFAWWALKMDRVRAFLTMLGVIIGSAAVVLVVTIAMAGRSYILEQIEGIGSNVAYATLDRTGLTIPADELTPGDLDAIRLGIPQVKVAAGTYDIPVHFTLRGKLVHARLVGISEDFQQIRRLAITSGRYFDFDDFALRSKVCLVTDRIAERAFGNTPAIGSEIQLDQFRCTVIGTFREGVPTYGRSEIQNESILVPFPLIRSITADNFFQVIYAQARTSGEVPELTQQMTRVLRERHRPEARYRVEDLSAILQTAENISIAMTVVLLAVALVTLTAAGTGIMNIMLVSVSQRTREIGIRMAIGARAAEIRLQFLLEAVFISFSGALLGIILAVSLIGIVAEWIQSTVPLRISWAGVLTAFVLSAGVGVLFGYRPASAAAKLNPVEALRTE